MVGSYIPGKRSKANMKLNKLLLFVGFTFCLFPPNLFARQIVVCADCEIKSVQQAIEIASPGDEILIKSGVYKEHNLFVDKPLIIRGEGNPVIDGEFLETIFHISTDDFVIQDLTIKNVGKSYTKDFAGILVSKSNNFTIKNITLEQAFFGMLIEKSHNGIISNNKISSEGEEQAGSGNGIHLWHCDNFKIFENELFGVRDGIYLEFVKESEVYKNKSYNNLRYGLHFMFSNNNTYYNNLFSKNGAGVAVMFSKFITMTHNTFLENWGSASYGLLLKEIYDAEIVDNTFEQNTIGVSVDGSTRVNFRDNTFVRNGWAVNVIGACYENIFEGNNFMHNSFDLAYNGKLNTNQFNQNFWSDYTGYDLDKDGFGDVPYRPVKLFSYVVNKTPETIVLLRSLFVDMINFSEKVSPVFTPDNLLDKAPLMKKNL